LQLFKNILVDHVIYWVHHLFFNLLDVSLFNLTKNLLLVYIPLILLLNFNFLFSIEFWFVIIIFFSVNFSLVFFYLALVTFFVIDLLQYEFTIIKRLSLPHFQSLIHRSCILSRKLLIFFLNLKVIIVTVLIPCFVPKWFYLIVDSLIGHFSQLISNVWFFTKHRFQEVIILRFNFVTHLLAVIRRSNNASVGSTSGVDSRC